MSLAESLVARAERDVRDAEERIARQVDSIRRLDEAGHTVEAREAEASLSIVRDTLEMARLTLFIARLVPEDGPDTPGL